MSQLPVLTDELARSIERLVAPELDGSEAGQERAGLTVARFGGTIASKATGGRPANKVYCFGHADLGRLQEILAFYTADGLEPWFYLAPMGFTPEVAAALTAAGFAQREFRQAILHGLPWTERPLPPSGVTVERVIEANPEQFVQTMADGFEWPGQWRDAAMEGVRRSFRPEELHFLARYEGEPAGVASLGRRGDVGSLSGAAVIPRLRGNGCHTALLHQRLYVAHELGCSMVLGGADFGSASFRNQQRAGLRLAYIESGWSRV